ncbi:MAG: hypothetical protein P8Y64_13300 [Gammaproteobacteria bacterium]|jgi:hypothetical protein
MKSSRFLLLPSVLLGAMAMAACGAAPAKQTADAQSGSAAVSVEPVGERVPGEYIVTLAAGADEAVIRTAYGEFGLESLKPLGERRYLMKLRDDPGPEAVVKRAGSSAGIEAVQPNLIYRLNPPSRSPMLR